VPVRNFRNLFVLRAQRDDGIVIPRLLHGMTLSRVEGSYFDFARVVRQRRFPMKQEAIKKVRQPTVMEHGVNLDVLGRALIAQADERIKWHRHGALENIADWKQHSRRTDLQSKMSGHLEHARFLTFVRQNIVPARRYRLGLTDMSMHVIMPKGSYW
jgi:hypothetical protein